MPTHIPAGRANLNATQARQIEQVCDRFEQAWRSGQDPQIENFIQDQNESLSGHLLRELVLLDLELRIQKGERPRREEYKNRFATQIDQLSSAFWDAALSAVQSTLQKNIGQDTVSFKPPSDQTLVKFGQRESGDEIEEFGEYRIINSLGQVGMGSVYRAFEKMANREVLFGDVRMCLNDSS